MRVPFRAFALTLGWLQLASARPPGPEVVCDTYPGSPACQIGTLSCNLCHTSVSPVAWNVFGDQVRTALHASGAALDGNDAFAQALRDTLPALETLDADADGVTNAAELAQGTSPGDPASNRLDVAGPCPADPSALPDPGCSYDSAYVLRKLLLDFCGHSPSFEQTRQLEASSPEAQRKTLHAALDECLQTPYWRGRDGVLWRLAHPKVRPAAFGDSAYSDDPSRGADYEQDYQLFVYTQIDGHDARDVLLGQYFVVSAGDAYQRVDELAGQSVPVERRAGMLTTLWFLLFNSMFTALPRSAAAQAYRAYLGYDIARQQGLFPVDDEPVDYDRKGVAQADCAVCHSTLDPLTYPFRNYDGISGEVDTALLGRYVPDRLETLYEPLIPGVSATPERGVIFGQPVDTLREWVEVAANSDEFARATVSDYWSLLLGEAPTPEQSDEFEALWRSLRSDSYSIDALLHRLIDSEAYGVP